MALRVGQAVSVFPPSSGGGAHDGVPQVAGGAVVVFARGDRRAHLSGVESRAGASGAVAAEKVYRAAALPVVASPVPEVLKMGNLVYTAHSPEEWVSQIERALHEDCPELRRQRREFAQRHSWDNRAKQVIEIIEKHYDEWVANALG